MKTNHQILKELNDLEIKNQIYEVNVKNNISLYRLVRFNIRVKYLNENNGFTNKTENSELKISELLKYFFISLFQLFRLITSSNKIDNFVFAFPRLFNTGNEFIDKFTDPVLEFSELKDNTIIFQHSFGNPHLNPRKNNNKVVYADFIDIVAKFISLLTYKINVNKYRIEIDDLQKKINLIYGKDFISKKEIALSLTRFLVYIFFYKQIIKIVKPNNIFLVSREVFKFISYLGKQNNIKVFEFQHGITQTETPFYTGPYLENMDPDYFLVFGEAWKNDFYGIPKDKIINIGWAYKDYVQKIMESNQKQISNKILVISSPAITDKILSFVIDAINFNSLFEFDIRLHPQEKLSINQLNSIEKHKNITISNNKEDSIFAIQKYNTVIGDNSSVLYEALSMGKNVGKINMNQIFSRNLEEDIRNGFFIINTFIDIPTNQINHNKQTSEYFYSNFNQDIFNTLIK
ncbi:hypothetical protein OBK03_06255 [Empedobacter falsenii]